MAKKVLGTLIHGIGACQNIDSSGEIIEIEGIDTSSVERDVVINFEHLSTNATQVIGKITSCKKILKKEDCENEHHRYFWDKVECPYLYVKGILFDGYGHSGAKDAVAMLKFDQDLDKENTRQVSGFSIEGSRLGKEGNRITKCIMRKMSFTNTPCQKQCIAEMLEDDKPIEITAKQLLAAFKKSEEINNDLSKAEYNSKLAFKLNPKPKKVDTYKPITPATGEHREGTAIKPAAVSTPAEAPAKQKVGQRVDYKAGKTKMRTGYQIYHDPETWKSETNSVRKEILKNMSNQNIRSRMMLSERKEEMRKDILKSMADDAFEHFEKKEELVAFVADKYPEMSEVEVLAFVKTFAFVQMKKSEMDMVKMAGEIDNDLNKARVDDGKRNGEKRIDRMNRGTRDKHTEKGVHKPHYMAGKKTGTSEVGAYQGGGKLSPDTVSWAKEKHKEVMEESKKIKPNLPKSEQDIVKKDPCWDGYEKVKGKKDFSEDSCKKITKDEQKVVKADDSYGYSEKNPKIDIHIKGKYHKSTNWAKNLKQAKEKHLERNPEHKSEDVKAYYSNPKVKK